MKKAVLILCLVAAPAWPQCATNCTDLVYTDSSVRIDCDFPSGVNRVRLARFTAGVIDADATQPPDYLFNPSGAGTLGGTIMATDFAASTSQEIMPQLSTDGGSTWGSLATCGAGICPSGAGVQPGGYTCDANNLITFTTEAAPGTDPEPPTLPTATTVVTVPAVTGNTYTVSACANMQSTFDTAIAQANSDNLIHQVTITAGRATKCKPDDWSDDTLDLGGVTTSTGGIVVVAEPADPDNGPRGARVEPDHYAACPGIKYDPHFYPTTSLITASSATKRIWWTGCFGLGTPERGDLTGETDIAVSSFSDTGSTWEATLASDPGLPAGTYIGLKLILPGIEGREASRGRDYNGTTSQPVTITTSGGYKVVVTEAIAEAGGSYSGGGYLLRRRLLPFTATAASPPVLTTDTAHHMVNGVAEAMTGVTSDVLTVSDGAHKLEANQMLWIVGATGSCNGLNWASAVNQGAGTITLGETVSDCTGGTVTPVYMVQLSNLSGVTYTKLSCVADFTASDQVTLRGCVGDDGASDVPPDWSSGSGITGDLSMDPAPYPPFIDLTNMDEVYFSGIVYKGAPNREPWASVQYAVQGINDPKSDVALVRGFFNAVGAWRWSQPLMLKAYDTDFSRILVPIHFRVRDTDKLYLRANDAVGGGFFWFADNANDIKSQEDLVAIGNRMIYDQRFSFGAGSAGAGINTRQCWETKPGLLRALFEGNTCYKVPAVATAVNTMFSLQYSSDAKSDKVDGLRRYNSDLTLRYNYNVGRFFAQLGLLNLGGEYERRAPQERINVHNNLSFDFSSHRPTPSGEFLTSNSTIGGETYGGGIFMGPTNHRHIHHNTIGWNHGGGSWWISTWEGSNTYWSSTSTKIQYNALVNSQADSGQIDMRCLTGYNYSSCSQFFEQEGSASARFVMDNTNVIIPGTLDTDETDFTAANNAHSDQGDAFTTWPSGNRPSIISGSADSQSLNTRVALAWESDWTRKAALGGAGHDHAELLKATGRPVLPAGALEVGSGKARVVGYTAPTSGACYLCARPAADDLSDTSTVCQQDSGAQDNRSVTLTGITSGTTILTLKCEYGIQMHWHGSIP